jgi:hypothetical protein
MLFTGWEVCNEKSFAQGLEYNDRGQRFSQYGPNKAGE